MKKFVFSLLAIASFSFASATEIKTGEPIKEKPASEITVAKNEAVKETEELKTVSCTLIDPFTGDLYVHTYSCFFCWGGSKDACLADGVKTLEAGW